MRRFQLVIFWNDAMKTVEFADPDMDNLCLCEHLKRNGSVFDYHVAEDKIFSYDTSPPIIKRNDSMLDYHVELADGMTGIGGDESLIDAEKTALVRALRRSGWIQKEAAKRLRRSARKMNYLVRKHNIEYPWRINCRKKRETDW